MKAYSHSFRLSMATVLAMLLGSYVFASEAHAGDLREISRVNQGISIEGAERVGDVSSVNGRIRVGSDVTVQGSLETVNGSIRTGSGTHVEKAIETVNGSISVRNTQVGEDIETANGNIELLNGSVVAGDLIVRGKHQWWDRLFDFSRKRPDITIDGDSRVLGDIHLYQEVDLHISRDAVVGEIIEHF